MRSTLTVRDETTFGLGDDREFLLEVPEGRVTVRDLIRERVYGEVEDHSCHLTERFLVVQGELRTYKIYLGSGNILMEPNDQYLCIVPSQGTRGEGLAGKVFLPFEGDRTLAVILSKAFLLAEDKKIKDPTIVRQIRA